MAVLFATPLLGKVGNRSNPQFRCVRELRSLKDGIESETSEENSLFPNLDNREYVRLVYRSILGREPDIGGWDNWEEWLNRGATRAWVAWKQLDSTEFRERWGSS